MKRKIIKTTIKDKGKMIEIKTNLKDAFQYIWIPVEALQDIALMIQKW